MLAPSLALPRCAREGIETDSSCPLSAPPLRALRALRDVLSDFLSATACSQGREPSLHPIACRTPLVFSSSLKPEADCASRSRADASKDRQVSRHWLHPTSRFLRG